MKKEYSIQYNILHNFLVPEQGILLGFSTPEQGGKFKTPVAHTHLIKAESPGRRLSNLSSQTVGDSFRV